MRGMTWWWAVVCLLGSLVAHVGAAEREAVFHAAQPVWASERQTEMNLALGFRAAFRAEENQPLVLRLACSTVYRAWLNGSFLANGPARGPHGHYRIDELPLSAHLRDGVNIVAIEVVGYNVNSYYTMDQPSFLQAEILGPDRQVLAATGSQDRPFQALVLQDRVQRVQRYSFQRPFIEVYRLAPGFDQWRVAQQCDTPVRLTVVDAKPALPRRVPYPLFELRQPTRHVSQGLVERRDQVEGLWKDRSLTNIGPQLKGYPEHELELVTSTELQHYVSNQTGVLDQAYRADEAIALAQGQYRILDMGVNLSGMPGITVSCRVPTRLWLVFDEILSGDDVDFKRLGCVNAITYEVQPGTYEVDALEPYTYRYLKLICAEGECEVTGIRMREYKHPPSPEATFACSDAALNRLFEAGVETFRQNAVDVFMDCPSRERAGWLCDSFFTSRVARDLTGTTCVEQCFYENFLLPETFEHLPRGMLPMCYPADHYDGVFIPNWALWFVVQLEEYAQRSGDRAMVEALRDRVLQLFDFFAPLENSDGLLEKLPGWVFVEWSDANKYVQDVNYPSNMLYAGALAAAARLYELPALAEKADAIRDTIRQQSFDGTFFVDNALRRDGSLEVTKNRTEVCQYFAFFFDVASPKTHPQLWRILRDEFGPDRKETRAYAEVGFANSFIGNMLRFELLSQNGCAQQILDESSAYLLYMAERTGTLWENDGAYASCNHGFASHIVHTLYRDVLGLAHIDSQRKRVHLRFGTLRLEHCQGTLPTPDGLISLQWRWQGDALRYRVQVPAGYEVEIDNESGKQLVEQPQ